MDRSWSSIWETRGKVGIDALALLLAKSLAPTVASKLASAAVPQEKLLRWVGRDPPRLALRAALREALTAFAARRPDYARAWFDDVFLGSKAVAAELAKAIPPGAPPDPVELARLYVAHLGPVRDRDGAIRKATPVAADFLELLRERLRQQEPFRPLFDSVAQDASAADLARLAETLADVPDLLKRLDRAPARLVAHIRPFTTVRENRTAHFVGREWLFAEIDERLLDPELPCGYIIIRGEPGIGKSALMAELVRTRDYVHHFNVATDGIRTHDQFLRNACAQLIQRYGLPHDELPPHAGQDPGLLDILLHEAVAVAEAQGDLPVVLVVDALDEAEPPPEKDRKAGLNRLRLPNALPDHVYVIATIRKHVDEVLAVARRADPIELREDDPRNRLDVRTYVEEFLERRADVMPARLAEWRTDAAAFVERLQERSEGNFMYLTHVLDDIAAGKIEPATFGGRLEGLPVGLNGYYVRHWRAMHDSDRDRFERVQRPIVCTLATAPGAVPAAKVAEWINASGEFEAVTLEEVEDALEEWHQFLNLHPGDPPRWRIYHASFAGFLEREVGLRLYRRAAVAATRSKVAWDM